LSEAHAKPLAKGRDCTENDETFDFNRCQSPTQLAKSRATSRPQHEPCADAETVAQGIQNAPTELPRPVASDPSQASQDQTVHMASMHEEQGILGLSVKQLRDAVTLDSNGNATAADREMLIQGFETFAAVLDKLGNIGSHLSGNTKKLRNSTAVASITDYEEWLISELPVHASKNYKDYADPSAGVASLWIGWTLEFFVEMFDNLQKGKETVASINDAYKITLSSHHNFIMRNAFALGVRGQMPNRKKFYELLQGKKTGGDGSVGHEVLVREIGQFVEIGRSVVRYLLHMHDVMTKKMQAERGRR